MAQVVVVGGVNQDVVVRAPRRPQAGETVVGAGPTWSPGGKGANMAVAAARAGAEVSLCAVVGDDAHGRDQVRLLEAAGVGTGAVRRSAEHPTGVALIVVTPDGENSIVVGAGANATLRDEDVRAAVADATVVLVQTEVGAGPVGAACSGSGRLVLSLAPVVGLPAAVLSAADPLVVNEEEASELAGGGSGADPLALARGVVERTGCASLVLTLGAAGALVADAEGVTVVDAPRVAARDTTGAGDVLAGVLAARLATGQDLLAATRAAVAAAAASVQHDGAR